MPRINDSDDERPDDSSSDLGEPSVPADVTMNGGAPADIEFDDTAGGSVEQAEDEEEDAHSSKRARTSRDGSYAKKEKDSNSGRRKGRVATDENEGDDDEGDEEDGQAEEDGEFEVEEEPERKPKVERAVMLPRDKDGYVPGSIVRVKLENFVTYDKVEFHPGPYLNMILGPNGTGKSSIACALCIGLGWHPNILGRANELNAFAKHGADSGFIEIELKGPPGKRNLVIRRKLNARDRRSTFTLNGEGVTQKDVQTRVAALGVQVGNLCSFLPQDKVSEFAQMSPQQLLKETQRVAGAAELTDWHTSLIKFDGELKELEKENNSSRADIEHLVQQNSLLEKEVKRYEARQKIEQEIALYELFLPYLHYGDAKKDYQRVKDERSRVGSTLKQLEEKNAPLHEKKTEVEKIAAKVAAKKKAINAGVDQTYIKIKRKSSEQEQIDADAEDLQKKLDILKNNEKQRKLKINSYKRDIVQLENEIANPPEFEDMEQLNKQLADGSQVLREASNQYGEAQDRQREVADRNAEYRHKLELADQEMANLKNKSLQRVHTLSRWDKDAADACIWLRANQHRFAAQVFEPAYVSIDVPDPLYRDAVESCFNNNQLKTFVAQNANDYKLLNELINDQGALGRKARINTWYRPKDFDKLMPPPMEEKQLHALGFNGYAIDYVQGPDGLLWYLQKELNLHRTAIGLDPSKIELRVAIEAVSSRESAPTWPPPATTFIAGRTQHRVSRSAYGKQLPQSMAVNIRPSRNFTHEAADPSIKAAIEQKTIAARQGMAETEQEMAGLSEEAKQAKQRHTVAKAHQDQLKARKAEIQNAIRHFETKKVKLGTTKEKLEKEENAPSAETERKKLKSQLLHFAKKRVKSALELKALIEHAKNEHAQGAKLGLEHVQLTANVSALAAMATAHDEESAKIRAEWDALVIEFNDVKALAKRLSEEVKEAFDSADPVIKEQFQALPDEEKEAYTVEEILGHIEGAKAKLELSHATSANVVERYKTREAQIEEKKQRLDQQERRAAKVAKNMQTVKDQWYPALKDLISSIGDKFSAAFDRIGCAGEIKISENEDYKEWAIDILVKFRDKEKLQLLTGQRQSGGERSLTTILYLMSLTELARAPFSLVDEINQGMDHRAERAVHNQLVEVTCKGDSGQYFLITPKLLPALRYHERMRVLCVYNGEWLPEEQGIGSMKSLLDSYVRANPGLVAAH